MSPVLYSNCHCLIPVMWLCYIDLHAMNITISRWGIMPTYATAQGHAYNIHTKAWHYGLYNLLA